MKSKLVPLPILIRELEALTGQPVPYTNRSLWIMIVNNKLPAQQINGRWKVDVYAAARALDLPIRHNAA